MKYILLLSIISFSIGCICSKENIMPPKALTGQYSLYSDTMHIILKIDSCAEVYIYKKNAAEIQYLIKADTILVVSDSLYQMSDTLHFFIKKKRAISFAKKIIEYKSSLYEKAESLKNCNLYPQYGPLNGLVYHLLIQNSFCSNIFPAYAPHYYMEKCNNLYDKEFIEMINEFHKLIGAPKIKPKTS